MNDRLNRILPDYGDFSPDSFLTGFSPAPEPAVKTAAPARKATPQERPERRETPKDTPKEISNTPPREAKPSAPASDVKTAESIAERSRRAAMSSLGRTLRRYQSSPEERALDDDALEDIMKLRGLTADTPQPEPEPVQKTEPAPEPKDGKKRKEKKKRRFRQEPKPAPAPEPKTEEKPEPEAKPEPRPEPKPEPKPESKPEPTPGAEPAPHWERESAPEPDFEKSEPRVTELRGRPRHPRFIMGEDGIITLIYGGDGPAEPQEPEKSEEAENAPEPPAAEKLDGRDIPEAPDEGESDEKAPDEAAPPAEKPKAEPAPSFQERLDSARRRAAQRKSERRTPKLSETVLAPAVRIVALIQAKRQQQAREAASWPEPEDIPETPELSPKNAAKYYAKRSKRMKRRLRISFILTAVLAWIAFGLPLAGALGSSVALQSGVSLILTLVVMLLTVDIVTTGLRQLLDLAPGPEALALLSALLSCVDAALVLLGYGTALPFCAVGAAALTAALWGSRLSCRALMRTFRTAADSRSPSCIAADPGTDKIPRRLFRAERDDLSGLVRRSEGQDICRATYASAAPIILLAALLLSIAASVGGNSGYFLHTFSALVSVGSSFAAFFGFSLPYSIAARRLRAAGAAIAGYAGCADIAKTRELIVTDGDLFPPGTMRFSAINILEGVPQQKVIIAASSLIFAANSGAAPLFEELCERRGCHVTAPREYSIHESGGLSGIVNAEHVDVGPARFMNLQGIRLPQNMTAKNAVCVAISGELVGVFIIDYTPFSSVQEALVSLLRGRFSPVFAVRDFNITPRMVHDLFKLPSTNFNFPAYRDRTRISPDPDRPIDAVVTRSGMLPFVEAAEAGRRLYANARASTILSLIGAAIGMVILFLLCRTGAFDTASVGNALMFMLLWSLPAVILSYGRGK